MLSPLLGPLITSFRMICSGGHFTGLMLVTLLGGPDSSIWWKSHNWACSVDRNAWQGAVARNDQLTQREGHTTLAPSSPLLTDLAESYSSHRLRLFQAPLYLFGFKWLFTWISWPWCFHKVELNLVQMPVKPKSVWLHSPEQGRWWYCEVALTICMAGCEWKMLIAILMAASQAIFIKETYFRSKDVVLKTKPLT